MAPKVAIYDISKSHTFDLECTTLEPTQCWLAASVPLENASMERVELFYDLKSLINYIFSPRHKDHRFYAHNLSYDISFIWAWLRDNANNFEIKNVISPLMGGCMYCAIVYKGITIHFYDTVPKFGGANLDSVISTYTDLKKGITPIYETMDEVVIDDYNEEYCKIDALGLALAIPKAMESGTSLTAPSDAYKHWNGIMESKYTRQGRNKRYPAIPLEMDKDMRRGYRGGFTFLNPMYKDKVIDNVNRYDVNSMYPDKMRNCILPYGKPQPVKTGKVVLKGVYKLGLQRVVFSSASVRNGCCPFIATSKGFRGTNSYDLEILPKRGASRCVQILTLQELEKFLEYYEVEDLRYSGGWMFRGCEVDFNEFIDESWEQKSSPDPVIKNKGKLHMNSLYGKFAESPDKPVMYVDFEGDIATVRPTGEVESKPKGYLPLGIFITSYSRLQLLEAIEAVCYDKFIYCDTDSIHTVADGAECGLDLHPTRLGAWDYEGTFKQAKYLRAKRYMGIEQDESTKVVCAGINKRDLKEQVKDLEGFYEGRGISTRKFKNGVNGKHVKPQITKI